MPDDEKRFKVERAIKKLLAIGATPEQVQAVLDKAAQRPARRPGVIQASWWPL